MNTCEKCSNPVPEEKAFCPNCGAAMMPERKRMPEIDEEMGETMIGFSLPVNVPPARVPVPLPPAEAQPAAAPPPFTAAKPATASSHREASVMSYNELTRAVRSAPAVGGNRTLFWLLIAAATLFALSLAFVAVLYFMDKI